MFLYIIELWWVTFEQASRGEEIHLRGCRFIVSFFTKSLRNFIFNSIEIFFNISVSPDTVTFKKIPGAPPIMKFLNAADEVVEEVDLSLYTKDGCNMLLEKQGFLKKSAQTEETNEEL